MEMKYVIQASPLSKMFMTLKTFDNAETGDKESWQDRCLDDVKHLTDMDSEFTIEIPGGHGARRFTFNQPVMLTDERDSDWEAVYEFIAGGENGLNRHIEYDQWGVVPFRITSLAVNKMHQMAMLQATTAIKDPAKATSKEFQTKFTKLANEVANETKDALLSATRMSNEKVMRAIKLNYNALMNQRDVDGQRGVKSAQPTATNILGAISISDILKAQAKKKHNVMDQFQSTIEYIASKGI